jgi:hypothetical protein
MGYIIPYITKCQALDLYECLLGRSTTQQIISPLNHSTICSPAFFNYFIHFFSVQNTGNQYLFAFYPEYNTIIPHTEFPVTFQRPSQGLSIVLRCNKKSRLDRSPDSCSVCFVRFGKVLIFNRWMIFESIGHAKPIPPCGP